MSFDNKKLPNKIKPMTGKDWVRIADVITGRYPHPVVYLIVLVVSISAIVLFAWLTA